MGWKSARVSTLMALGFLVAGLWGGTHAFAQEPQIDALFSGKQAKVMLKLANNSKIVRVSEPLMPDSSPDFFSFDMYSVDTKGHKQRIAQEVQGAQISKKGDFFWVSHGELYDATRNKVISKRASGDFSVNADASKIIMVIPHDMVTGSLVVLDRNGKQIAQLMPDNGQHSFITFAPKEDKVLFVSSASGISSWYVADLKNFRTKQLTNVHLRTQEDILGPHFIPVPATRDGMGFVDEHTLRYDAGDGEWWEVNGKTGKAQRVEAP